MITLKQAAPWMRQAACIPHVQRGNDLWHNTHAYNGAKQICLQCPVLTQCRDYGDRTETTTTGGNTTAALMHGVIAAETPYQRLKRRRTGEHKHQIVIQGELVDSHCRNGHKRTHENTRVYHHQGATRPQIVCDECARDRGSQQ